MPAQQQAVIVRCYFMTDFTTFRKIGYTQAFKAITVGLVIAYVIMALMAGPFWLFQFDYAPTILFAAIIIYIAGFFFGGLTGIWISKRSKLAILFGIVGGFLIVWSATFFGSLIGFIKEGLPNKSEISEPGNDYIYKPMAMVTIFGFLPIILVGIWFGLSTKKKIDNILNG
jgi:glucan phosphoethanolaminetransferase (alkaline phosphatase superfamily)